MDQFKKSSGVINKSYGEMDKGADSVSKSSISMGGALTSLGAVMTTVVVGSALAAAAAIAGISVALIALGKASIKEGATYTKEMSNVKALTGATEEQFDKLSASAEELGATTKFTATEAAEGMSFLAMAGFEVDEIISAMPGVLNLAAAGNLDLATSADIASNIISGMGADISETDHIIDVLTATMTSSNTNLIQLGEGMKFVAPLAGSLGIDVEDLSAAMGILGDAGIQGTMGGTALRQALLNLASPTGAAKKVMDDLGLSVFDQSGKMLPLPDIIGRVAKATEGLTDEQKIQSLETIFGARNISAMSVLLEAGEDDLRGFGNELRESGGRAAEIAATQLDNLSGDVTLLQSAFSGVKIQIFKRLEPILRNIVAFATQMLERLGPLLPQIYAAIAGVLGKAFTIIQDVVNTFFASMDEGDDIFTALKKAIAELIPEVILDNVLELMDKFKELGQTIFPDMKSAGEGIGGMLTNVIAGAIKFLNDVILPALISAVQFVIDNWDDWVQKAKDLYKYFKEKVWPALVQLTDTIINDVIPAVSDFAKWISGTLIPTLKDMYEWFDKNIMPIISKVLDMFKKDAPKSGKKLEKTFKDISKVIQPIIKKVLPRLLELWDIILEWTEENWPLIQETIEVVMKEILEIIEDITTKIEKFWEKWGDEIIAITEFLMDTVLDIIETYLRNILDIIEIIMALITGDWERAWENIKDIVDRTLKLVSGIIQRGFDTFLKVISGIMSEIAKEIEKAWNDIKSDISSAMDSIKNIIVNSWGSIVQSVASKINEIKQKIISGFNEIKNNISSAMDSIKNTIVSKWNSIIDSVRTLVQKLIDTIISKISGSVSAIANSLISTMSSAISSLLSSVSSGGIRNILISIGETLVQKIIDGFNAVTDFAQNIINILSNWIQNVINTGSAIWNKATEIGKKIVTTIISGLSSLVSTFISSVRNLIGAWLSAILGSLGSIATAAYNIGKKIIDNLLSGVGSMASKFKSWVKDLIEDWLGDIFSPISVAQHMGESIVDNILTGFAKGKQGFISGIKGDLQNWISQIEAQKLAIGSNLPTIGGQLTPLGVGGQSSIPVSNVSYSTNNVFNLGGNTINDRMGEAEFEQRVVNVIRRHLA
jgi:TP901 family phage tail tape measure protein